MLAHDCCETSRIDLALRLRVSVFHRSGSAGCAAGPSSLVPCCGGSGVGGLCGTFVGPTDDFRLSAALPPAAIEAARTQRKQIALT